MITPRYLRPDHKDGVWIGFGVCLFHNSMLILYVDGMRSLPSDPLRWFLPNLRDLVEAPFTHDGYRSVCTSLYALGQ